MKVTVIVGPGASREVDAVDELAAALGQAAGVTVPVIEGSLADAPADGYLVAYEPRDLIRHPGIGPRVILINADRSDVLDELEQHRLAGAIEKHRYFQWRTQRDTDTGRGLFGHKDVAAAIDVTLAGAFETEHYGLFMKSPYPDLPSLLAAYLAAHERARGGVP